MNLLATHRSFLTYQWQQKATSHTTLVVLHPPTQAGVGGGMGGGGVMIITYPILRTSLGVERSRQ